jgi:hypothetical protein
LTITVLEVFDLQITYVPTDSGAEARRTILAAKYVVRLCSHE